MAAYRGGGDGAGVMYAEPQAQDEIAVERHDHHHDHGGNPGQNHIDGEADVMQLDAALEADRHEQIER